MIGICKGMDRAELKINEMWREHAKDREAWRLTAYMLVVLPKLTEWSMPCDNQDRKSC